MCRKYHIYYPGCGHTADDFLYMCPEATSLGRLCEHPIRLASPRTYETLCPDCRPEPETWLSMALMGETILGWTILKTPMIIWLFLIGVFSTVSFVVQQVHLLFQRWVILFRYSMQWLCQWSRTLRSGLVYYAQGTAVLTKLVVGTYLWPALRSLLWWTVAIAMTPFFVILAILEAIEEGIWPKLPKLFWKAVDIFTGEVFKFYAGFFLLLIVFVAPASLITKWVERITRILAPFQVARLYTWYRSEAWDRLGDFWAVATLSAVCTSILTSLFMTAPHASVLSFLNWWVYGIVVALTVAEPALSVLGALSASMRSDLPRLTKLEMVQSGVVRIKQEAVQNRLAWIPQIPSEILKLLNQCIQKVHAKAPQPLTKPLHQHRGIQTGSDIFPQTRAEPTYQDSAARKDREDIRYPGPDISYWRQGSYERDRASPIRQDSAVQTGREHLRYTGSNHLRWQRASYERVRPTDGDDAQIGIDYLLGHTPNAKAETNGDDD